MTLRLFCAVLRDDAETKGAAMFHDEPLHAKPEGPSAGEDLTRMGLEELHERRRILEEEITRTKAMIEQKQAGLNAAESIFRK